MLFQARVWHLVSDFATPPRMQQSILSNCGDQSYFMHNSQTTVTRFVPNLHVSPSADTEVPRLTSLAMLLHHLAKSSRIRGILTKPFTIRHFSPSVLLTTPNYGVSRRLWYYQVFKVRLFLICCLLSCVQLLLFICYSSIISLYTPKDTTF